MRRDSRVQSTVQEKARSRTVIIAGSACIVWGRHARVTILCKAKVLSSGENIGLFISSVARDRKSSYGYGGQPVPAYYRSHHFSTLWLMISGGSKGPVGWIRKNRGRGKASSHSKLFHLNRLLKTLSNQKWLWLDQGACLSANQTKKSRDNKWGLVNWVKIP